MKKIEKEIGRFASELHHCSEKIKRASGNNKRDLKFTEDWTQEINTQQEISKISRGGKDTGV